MRSAPVASFTSAQRSLICARVRSEAMRSGSSVLLVVLNSSMSVDERRQLFLRAMMRPDQRDGLAEVADIVVAQAEEVRIDLADDDVAEDRRLHVLEASARR